ncbi:heparinase II/III domain-containing protein [Microvirga subterranea]|nr:heparinase II/III family protein [Microvirga subterranea]
MSGVKRLLPSSIQHAGDSLPGATDGQHIIATKNRWSRIVLNYQDVSPDVWCEFSFEVTPHAEEAARNVHNFAAVGVAFLMEDGSSIDFSYVPGLSRAQIDPFNVFVAGPDAASKAGGKGATSRFRCTFFVPAPTRQVAISVRGWRNSHHFHVSNPTLRQFVQTSGEEAFAAETPAAHSDNELLATARVSRTWKALGPEPEWIRYNIVPGRPLFVRGQIVTNGERKDGALARIVYRDERGQELPLPYADTQTAPLIGAFVNVPAHIQARRFTLELTPPPTAASVEIGFQVLREDASVELVMPLEVSLEVGLLLENIGGDEQADGVSFLKHLSERLPVPILAAGQAAPDRLANLLDPPALAARLSIHANLRSLQRGESRMFLDEELHLAGCTGWRLPEASDWTEDPFRSLAWRHEFQSLAWLADISKGDDPESINRSVALALAWSRTNPWGQPADDLSLHPLAMATRTEALLDVLAQAMAARTTPDSASLLELLGEIVRHGFALAEIIGQNVFSHSIHQLHVSGSLLALAAALPRVPLATYWMSLALASLRQGFDELISPAGTFFERSLHCQLEAVSLGLILEEALEPIPESAALREHLSPRLSRAVLNLIKITDPGGMLPGFGDMPAGIHHASWLRRLMTRYGQEWLGHDEIKAELSYPRGARFIPLPRQGILAARSYEQGRDWAYFCASLSEQHNSHGHFDATSFVFSSGGVRWIVDSGGSTQHEIGAARNYLMSSRAHNVAVPDGREQGAGTSWLHSEQSIDDVRICEVRSNVYGPDYVHRRFYVMTDDLTALAVLDDFRSAQGTVTFEGLLHFDPKTIVSLAPQLQAVAFQRQKRLYLTPYSIVGTLNGIEIVQGLSEPPSSLQGFVAGASARLEAANVLCYRFSGTHRVSGGMILASGKRGMKAVSQALVDERFQSLARGPT